MLFAKLLGRLRGKRELSGQALPPKPSVNKPPRTRRNEPTSAAEGEGSGFDPYNSGSFKSVKAWERVNRR